MSKKAYYHLPGLFEFYELYKVFLPLFYEHREYFYDFCDIGSIYGAPYDALWGGGRVGFGEDNVEEILSLMTQYNISMRLTFSNSMLQPEHLKDKRCNRLCSTLNDSPRGTHGVIIHSDLLMDYLKENYPNLYLVSSTTKVITEFNELKKELDRPDFKFVVPDFRLNPEIDKLGTLTPAQKEKIEFLCNECCFFGCKDRKACYENVSLKVLGLTETDHICKNVTNDTGYSFVRAMKNPGFISLDAIKNIYLPLGFSNFKLEGRSLGSAMVLEFLLYYMTKPKYQINVREAIYLSSSLDLF